MLKKEDIQRVKGMGFLLNRGTENFSGRIVAPGTVFTAENFKDMSYIAEHFGNGKLIATSRQAVEIPGIPFDKIEEAREYAAAHNMYFGGTGSKIRPVTSCKGTTCVYGNFDTQALAKKIHDEYYLGWNKVGLPHKFKISVGGCPNSCLKPSLNDFGVEGRKIPIFNKDLCRGCKVCVVEKSCPSKAAKVVEGKLAINKNCKECGVCTGKCPFGAISKESETLYRIYVGGTWGKSTRNGTPLSRLFHEDEIIPMIEKSLLWFKKHGYVKERFGLAIERIGIEEFEREVFSDELIVNKEEILKAEIKEKN